MDWEECLGKRMVKQVSSDESLISALNKSSTNKLTTQQLLTMNSTTAASKISLAYDALRELLEALALENGYKLYNHECYTAFLKRIMHQSAMGDDFDEIRKIRNAINYYGKDVSPAEAESILKDVQKLIQKVNDLLTKNA